MSIIVIVGVDQKLMARKIYISPGRVYQCVAVPNYLWKALLWSFYHHEGLCECCYSLHKSCVLMWWIHAEKITKGKTNIPYSIFITMRNWESKNSFLTKMFLLRQCKSNVIITKLILKKSFYEHSWTLQLCNVLFTFILQLLGFGFIHDKKFNFELVQ